MSLTGLPEQLDCPDSWKYTEEWQEKYERTYGLDYLDKICRHSSAGHKIMYYICNMGEMALTKIKTQNLYIKRINAGTIDLSRIGELDIDWQSGHTWVRLHEDWEELFEIYNASKAPKDIVKIIDEVKTFMDAGQSHCQALLKYIANAIEDQNKSKMEKREEARRQIMQQRHKWEAIDIDHSKVEEGFVYLLSNDLMPGVYKIGFTARNPDKRAKELSEQYGLPVSFNVVDYWRTKDPYIVEQRIHEELASFRKGGEFFEIDLECAKEIIQFFISEL